MPDPVTITVEAQDTTFGRSGTSTQVITHTAGDSLSLQTVAGQGVTITKPSFSSRSAINLPTGFTALLTDPEFEDNTTDLYNRQLATAVALAQSGAASVRGGTARSGFAAAEAAIEVGINRFTECWKAIVAYSQVIIETTRVTNDVNFAYDRITLTDNEQKIMADHANVQGAMQYLGQLNAYNQALLQAYAAQRHYGTQQMITTDALTGQGSQAGGVNGFGSSSWR